MFQVKGFAAQFGTEIINLDTEQSLGTQTKNSTQKIVENIPTVFTTGTVTFI